MGIIITDRKEMGWEVEDCMYVAEFRAKWQAFVNAVMCFRIP